MVSECRRCSECYVATPALALIQTWPWPNPGPDPCPCLTFPSYPLTHPPSPSCQARGRLARQETRRMVAGDLLGELAAKRGSAARQSTLLAVPEVGPCASSGRAWWLWLARGSQGRDRPPGPPVTAFSA